MKTLHFLIALTFVVSIAVFSGCSNNEKEEAAAREQARLDALRVSDSLKNVRILDSLAMIEDSLLLEKEKAEAAALAPTATRTSTRSSSGSTKSGGTSQPAKVEEPKSGEFVPGKKGAETESGTDFTPGKKGETPAGAEGEKTEEPFVPGKKK